MLYGEMDDENENREMLEELNNKSNLRKKAIICGVIVLCCVVVMTISIIVSVRMKNNNSNEPKQVSSVTQDKKDQKKKKSATYEGEHMQIAEHDMNQIQLKFVPKENPNAQQQITDIYYSDEKVAYLTFDDGPSKNITPRVLDILKQENVPATFFVLGSRVELNPDLLRRTYEEGHYIANHGYSHEYSKIYTSKDTVFEEYVKTEQAIRVALGNPNYNTHLFRFPGGSSGGRYDSVKAEAKGLLRDYGINFTNWNCLTGDAEGRTNTDSLMECLIQTMEGDGAIIVLMHDASDKSYTADALPNVISYLREQGYSFKNFYEIFK